MMVNALALVRGIDEQGRPFEYETKLENISATGLYVRLQQNTGQGSRLFVLFPFPTASNKIAEAARVAVRGTIRRVEQRPDGTVGAGISFENYRLV
jgi:hypothetical protein